MIEPGRVQNVDTRTAGPGRPWQIRYRVGLTTTVVLLIAATGAGIAAATFFNTRAAIRELVADRARDLLRHTVTQVQSHMLGAVPVVELARMLTDQGRLASDSDRLARQLLLMLRANPEFSWISYSDEHGRFTGANLTSAGKYRVNQSVIRNGRTELVEQDVDAAGRWTPYRRQGDTGYDPRTRPFYRKARELRRRVWTEPYVFYDRGVPGITLAMPHERRDGALLGVFTVDFDLNFLSRFVAELGFGPRGRVFVLTQGGEVVAYPTLRLAEREGLRAGGTLVRAADVSDPILSAFLDSPAWQDARRLDPDTAPPAPPVLRHTRAGTVYVLAYDVLDIDQDQRWIVAAVAPEADFMGTVQRNLAAALGISGLALAGALGIALVLANRVSGPLIRLADEMEEVGDFRLRDRPPQRTIFKEVGLMDQALLRMKRSLRSFAYYVPTDLVRAMLASGQEATLQGQTRPMTVYFSDIVGFTSIAETMTPDELVQRLAHYLDEMTAIVAERGGTVDKFIGDAIMAFWGAPAETPDHAARACEAAVRAQRRLAALRADPDAAAWAPGLFARIGIATGDALVGNVGSRQRFNYTVMGDTVNLAARLEGLNRLYGTEVLASEATYRAAAGRVIARPVDLVQVKGKHEAVAVYELLGLAEENDPEPRELAALFEKALAAYVARDFRGAADGFARALALRPNDRPATVLAARCHAFIETPPPADWNGVYQATQK
jgi:adenylate cyclase